MIDLAAALDVGRAVGEGLGLAVPVVGTLFLFHKINGRERSAHFDEQNRQHAAQEGRITQLDVDIDGLTKQINTVINDNERRFSAMLNDLATRFLSRDEGTGSINRLDANIVQLTNQLGKLNDHLFDLAKVPRSTRGRLRGRGRGDRRGCARAPSLLRPRAARPVAARSQRT